MISRIFDYINKYNMLKDCQGIIVGLSGGADSVCLLHILNRIIKEKLGDKGQKIELVAVHVNHGIRGEAAMSDERAALEFAQALHIDCEVYNKDIPAMALEKGIGLELAGRNARYECFHETAAKRGWSSYRIAVAHHMNDQAETVLMRMVRGTGVSGLAAINPVNGCVIRPLLAVDRAWIISYVNEHRLSYVTDETNYDNSYTRNYIRNKLIAELETLNPRAVESISSLAAEAREYQEYIDSEVDRLSDIYIRDMGNNSLLLSDLESLHTFMAGQLIRAAVLRLKGDIKDFYRVHVQAVLALKDSQVGKQLNLPADLVAIRSYDGIVLSRLRDKFHDRREAACFSLDLADLMSELHCVYELPDRVAYKGVAAMGFELIDKSRFNKTLIQNDYTKYFDYDKIMNDFKVLNVRFKESGDVALIDKDGHKKKLNREFIDRKIESDDRDRVVLLAARDNIFWAVGVRRYENYPVTDETDRILKVTAMIN